MRVSNQTRCFKCYSAIFINAYGKTRCYGPVLLLSIILLCVPCICVALLPIHHLSCFAYAVSTCNSNTLSSSFLFVHLPEFQSTNVSSICEGALMAVNKNGVQLLHSTTKVNKWHAKIENKFVLAVTTL